MNWKLVTLSGIVVAALLVVCVRLSWLLTVESLEHAFALEQVSVFYDLKQEYMEGHLSQEDAADAVESYYPVGSKQKLNTRMSNLVERVRTEVIKDITGNRGAGKVSEK